MKQTIFLLLLILMSCGESTTTYSSKELQEGVTETPEDIISTSNVAHTSEGEIRYVNTTSNLNYRDAPDGEVLGKFKRNEELTIVHHSNIFKEITDEGKLIKGEWVGVLQEIDTVYVFDAFLSKTKVFSDVWSKFPLKKRPFEDTTSFDNIDTSQRLTKADLDELQLTDLYPDIHKDGGKVYPSYQLDYGDYKSIVVNVFKNEHELESVLIIYDMDNKLHKIYQGDGEEPSINTTVIAYDEIAESWSHKTAKFTGAYITTIDALYTEPPVIDTTLYHINNQGLINKVNTDFANYIRPNKDIKLHTTYKDTIQFMKYNDDGDYFIIVAKKNNKDVYLYYNWDGEAKYDFKKNDLIEVQWKMDSAFAAGDGETLYFSEFAIDAKKVKK